MPSRKPRVPRTRGGGKLTEAGYWQFVRSALREKSRRWWPIFETLKAARRPSRSKNKRLKWEFQCASCQRWLSQKEVSVDHITPAGKLSSRDDAGGFIERLFCEKDGLQVLCDSCHTRKTNKDRNDGATNNGA